MDLDRLPKVARLVPQEICRPEIGITSAAGNTKEEIAAGDRMLSALEELSKHVRRLEDDFEAVRLDLVQNRTRRIIALSDQIGLRQVGRVASDVAYCCDGQDEAALAATTSRLVRLLNQAIDQAAGPMTAF